MKYEFELTRKQYTFPKDGKTHTHGSYEVVLCMTQSGTFIIDGVSYLLRRGVMLLTLPNVPHCGVVDVASFDWYTLRISTETINQVSSLQTDFKAIFNNVHPCIYLAEEQAKELVALMEGCLTLECGFGGDIRREIYFLRIILSIGSLYRNPGGSKAPSISKAAQRFQPVIDYIHEHYADELTLEQLSEHFFMSKYHLSHSFKEITGLSIKSYIINYRIQQACQHLNSGMTVQSAGELAGFKNNSHFIKTFGKIIGMSPGKYAEKQQ